MQRQTRITTLVGGVALALVVALIVVLVPRHHSDKHLFGLYVSADIEKADANRSAQDAGLRYAHQAGFDEVISYNLFQAKPDGVRHYLDAAHAAGLRVMLNLQEWGKAKDSHLRAFYARWYGKTPDAWATTIVQEFANHPAVSRINVTDEHPEDPSTGGNWLQDLRHKEALIRRHTSKPILLTLYHNHYPEDARRDFYATVLSAGDELALDYYPIPNNPRYGDVRHVSQLGDDLQAINPGKGWFVEQAFAWSGAANRVTGESLGFPADAPAPTVEQMVDMARRALSHGAAHVMFYALPDLSAPERQNLAHAMRKLRSQYR